MNRREVEGINTACCVAVLGKEIAAKKQQLSEADYCLLPGLQVGGVFYFFLSLRKTTVDSSSLITVMHEYIWAVWRLRCVL